MRVLSQSDRALINVNFIKVISVAYLKFRHGGNTNLSCILFFPKFMYSEQGLMACWIAVIEF
jgi:hypothetical protein